MERARLDRLLRPRSVAIVGASDRPGALGASVLANLDRAAFAGEIHLINPARAEIGGRPCLPAIEAPPPGVDAAVLAIPRGAVVEAVRGLAARGVGAAIVFSAGFAEDGEAGLADQRTMASVAADAEMVIEGPNCLGFANHVDGIALTFVETDTTRRHPLPGVGIVSQSGAMAAVLGTMLQSRDLALSYSISTGNEAASGVEDFVEWLIADAHTRTIAMIVEQFRDPQRFLSLARRAGKPIVLLHPGRSGAARASAATHTGAMAGDWEVMRLHVERAGVIVAHTLEELGDLVDLVHRCPVRPAGGTAVITESGAFKAMTLDLADEIGLDLPPLDDASTPALRAAMPAFIPVANPLDLTAQALVDPDLYRRTLEAVLADDRFGSVVLGIIQTDATTSALKFPPIVAAIEALRPDRPVLFAGLDEGAAVPPAAVARLRASGVPWFPSPERALRALARLARADSHDRTVTDAPPLPLPGARPEAGVVPEHRAKALLAPLGIPFPRGGMATSLEEAQAVAAAIGWPVVLKAQSAALSHKSDAGGVVLDLPDADALADGWHRLQADVAAAVPGLRLDGVLVEAMDRRGMELILGARRDPDWGPVLLAGFGGVQAEILRDVRLLPADLPEGAIVAELHRLKSAPLLRGFRGAPPLDVAAVAAILARLGRLLRAEPAIREIDLNPVVVHPAGQGVVALDALMLVD